MAMTYSGYRNQPIDNAKEDMESASEESGIRMFNVGKTASYAPSNSIKGNWILSNPKNIPHSALSDTPMHSNFKKH
jgi:hypothetical protein